MNEKEIKILIAQVTAEVVAEVQRAEVERGISIAELSEQAKKLGGGRLDTAWKISYDTSSKIADKLEDLGSTAWKISYDTSSKVLPDLNSKK